jgi:IS605 OrfB family transposase
LSKVTYQTLLPAGVASFCENLWSKQFNLEENVYNSHEDWLKDWQQTRSSQFTLIGSKDETNGNQNCQLVQGTLKIRVPKAFEHLWGKYYLIEGVNFPYGQENVDYALKNNQALTFRLVRKKKGWYVLVSLELPATPTQSYRRNGMLGIDLNPSVIGWSYCDREGNLQEKGQIRLNIQDKNRHQTQAIIGDAVKELIGIAEKYQCPIAVESLDFRGKKASMKEQGVKYSRRLSNFAYSCFSQMLVSRADKYGIEVIKVNPAYSSVIGLTKFMSLYGLSSDTAAALVIARRALRLSERVPPNFARLVQVDSHRHVWSLWNALSKKFKGLSRHNFFRSGANSPLEVSLLDELSEKSEDRFGRKSQDTSRLRCESSAPVDSTVRSMLPTYIQLSLF